MKKLYLSLIAMLAVVVFAGAALADPGTTWDKKLTKGRFTVLTGFSSRAVIDNETGRVWEQSPSTSTFTWFDALSHCYTLEVGGRKGWRLPTIEELASLVDTSQFNPALPDGHKFSNVQSSSLSFYWSATTNPSFIIAGFPGFAWGVTFLDGSVGNGDRRSCDGCLGFLAWCVRGGQGIDGVL